jgi:hypothetical protein
MHIMLNREKSLEPSQYRTEEYCSRKNDISDMVEVLGYEGKPGRGFSSMDNLEEMDIAMERLPEQHVSANLPKEQKNKVCH